MASDLEKKIIKQVEYYFGDYNLPKDKFLQEKIKEDEGWVELSVLLTFKRLANLTTDSKVIVDALKQSESGLLDVNEDGTKIRRSPEKSLPELTDDLKKEIMARTAYAKGFPQDEVQDNISAFAEEHGPIESCSMRTYLDKATKEHKFKGSCFFVFKNLEDCKKFVEAESIKYKDTELVRKFQESYIEGKKQEFHNRKNEKKKKKEEVEKAQTAAAITFPKGAILHFSGIADDQVLTREEIKEKFCEVSDVEPSYIDYKKELKEGYIRLPNENDAVEFHKKLTDGILEVNDVKLQLKVLEGDEEQGYMDKTRDIMSKMRQTQKRRKKGGKPNNQHHSKRKADEDNEPAAKKKVKT